jgi:hypothetical protein
VHIKQCRDKIRLGYNKRERHELPQPFHQMEGCFEWPGHNTDNHGELNGLRPCHLTESE